MEGCGTCRLFKSCFRGALQGCRCWVGHEQRALLLAHLSGLFRRQRMGDSRAATGRAGALGVDVDMMYC